MKAQQLKAYLLAVRSGALLVRTIRVVLLAEIVLFGSATVLGFFKDIDKYPYFARIVSVESAIESPASVLVKAVLPVNFKGTDISRWLFLIAVYVAATFAVRIADSLDEKEASIRAAIAETEPADSELAALERNLRSIAHGEKLDRRRVLQIYTEAKKTLESQKKHLAFLSVDVVNSTGMKVGESAENAERDFQLYKKMLEKILKARRALKSAWTPDGVMICFETVPDAVDAGTDLLAGLVDFNRRVKSIKHDFAVRIGVNAGDVAYDEAIPMEEMTDRVIDIAGHMQKHGTIDRVCVTRQSIEPHLGRYPFLATGRVVDGCEVFESPAPADPKSAA